MSLKSSGGSCLPLKGISEVTGVAFSAFFLSLSNLFMLICFPLHISALNWFCGVLRGAASVVYHNFTLMLWLPVFFGLPDRLPDYFAALGFVH